MGVLVFYVLWPLIWMYSPLFRRVRVVITHNDRLLVVKNFLGPGVWQLPGGGIKFGESVQAAGIREVEEEVGLTLKKVTPLHEGVKVVQQFGLLMRYQFVFVSLDREADIQKSRELTDAKWITIADNSNVSEEVKLGLRLVHQQR